MTTLNASVYSAMQTGSPYKSYKKTIIGRVFVNVLNSFTKQPEGMIISGIPNKDESCIIDVWDEMEDVYFKRMNKKHLDQGTIIPFTRPVEPTERPKTFEESTDEELREFLGLKHVSILKKLDAVKSEAIMIRLINLARDMEKSEKLITALEAKLSEIQQLSFTEQN